ncbi:MAG: hypothetical protein GYA21_16515 [Myxococcales bacterium]|nr:hypothetical protein [Myxococcales bacterium]
MKTKTLTCGLLAAALFSCPAGADQLQCNDQRTAERAVQILAPGSLMIDFCSLCTDSVKVVLVRSARAVQDCNYEVQVEGTVLLQSEQTFSGRLPEKVRYRITEQAYQKRVDLAYAYVEKAPNDFRWLGGVLGLRAEVKVPAIRLPADLYGRLGRKPSAAIGNVFGATGLGEPPHADTPPSKKLSECRFTGFSEPRLREIVAAYDAGKMEEAIRLGERLLDDMIARALSEAGLRGASAKAAREVVTGALQERLDYGGEPLRGIQAGRELLALERLPLPRLERAVLYLAVYGASAAEAANRIGDVEASAHALLSDSITLADLYRRPPRAAALAQFYAALYLGCVQGVALNPDEIIVARRLRQYFLDERAAFSFNYADVLGRILQQSTMDR